jgi:hypothetical protein
MAMALVAYHLRPKNRRRSIHHRWNHHRWSRHHSIRRRWNRRRWNHHRWNHHRWNHHHSTTAGYRPEARSSRRSNCLMILYKLRRRLPRRQ